MTKNATSFLLLILLTAVVAAASPGDSTNGHGVANTVGSFVFDAKETGSGAVTGKVRFVSLNIDIEVDCLIISGDIAIIGGTDVASPSTTYAFKVTDNGGGATADKITLPQVGQTCATFNTLGNFSLTSGDIEVRDQP